jgi:ribosomal protein S18 acetylase RimI-like enzyme
MSQHLESKCVTMKGASVHIREAVPDDARQFRELRLESLRMHPESFGEEHVDLVHKPLEYWVGSLAGRAVAGGKFWVADDGQELVGMIMAVRNPGPKLEHSARLHSVYVRQGRRATGIADRLVLASIAWLRSRSVRIVKLRVLAENTAAIRLYWRCGFSISGIDPEVIHFQGRYLDQVAMYRRLE